MDISLSLFFLWLFSSPKSFQAKIAGKCTGSKNLVKKSPRNSLGTSLVAQWLRIHLPMQGTWVRALVREDPTCRRATKPVLLNYWACALEPASHNYWSPHALEPVRCNYWAHEPQLLKPARLEPMLRNKRSHHNEKLAHCNTRVVPTRLN